MAPYKTLLINGILYGVGTQDDYQKVKLILDQGGEASTNLVDALFQHGARHAGKGGASGVVMTTTGRDESIHHGIVGKLWNKAAETANMSWMHVTLLPAYARLMLFQSQHPDVYYIPARGHGRIIGEIGEEEGDDTQDALVQLLNFGHKNDFRASLGNLTLAKPSSAATIPGLSTGSNVTNEKNSKKRSRSSSGAGFDALSSTLIKRQCIFSPGNHHSEASCSAQETREPTTYDDGGCLDLGIEPSPPSNRTGPLLTDAVVEMEDRVVEVEDPVDKGDDPIIEVPRVVEDTSMGDSQDLKGPSGQSLVDEAMEHALTKRASHGRTSHDLVDGQNQGRLSGEVVATEGIQNSSVASGTHQGNTHAPVDGQGFNKPTEGESLNEAAKYYFDNDDPTVTHNGYLYCTALLPNGRRCQNKRKYDGTVEIYHCPKHRRNRQRGKMAKLVDN
jgi:hypothetical protein